MAKISLVRIDSRLIHGQVITKWRKIHKVTKIIIVDNELAKDDFMIHIYETSAPKDVKVKIYDIPKAVRLWEKNQYKDGEVMLLFKDIKTCLELYKLGVPMEYVQLGGLPKAPDKRVILRAVSLGEEDMSLLREFDQRGVEVAIHIVPEEVKMPFTEIEKKYRES